MSDVPRMHADEFGLGPDPNAVRNVVAIRPGGVTDVVRAVPALRHLRASYPHARLTIAAPSSARELLDACPYVDRVIAIEQPSEAILERFDVAISWADPSDPTTLDIEEIDAQFRASWRVEGAPARRAIHPAWPERLDAATRMVRLAWLLGGDLQPAQSIGLWSQLADRNGAARLVADATRPIAVVHVGGHIPERRWPSERWAVVIDQLDAAGLDPVLVGTADDQSHASDVLALVRQAPISVVARTTIGELCGLLERAVLFVGGDLGPAAMAGAVGVRSVVIGPASRFEHASRPGLVDLVDAGACAECHEHACVHPPASAESVSLERALARVELAAATALDRWSRAQIA